MSDSSDELIPPGHPRFEGAEFLSRDALVQHVILNSEYLHGAAWQWSSWKERDAVIYDPETGGEKPGILDHDHCHFCHDSAFSVRYAGDLREGWATSGPAGLPIGDQQPGYHWVCPECFERYRGYFDWTVERR